MTRPVTSTRMATSGGASGIETTLAKDERKHETCERAKGNDAKKTESDGECDREVVFASGVERSATGMGGG